MSLCVTVLSKSCCRRFWRDCSYSGRCFRRRCCSSRQPPLIGIELPCVMIRGRDCRLSVQALFHVGQLANVGTHIVPHAAQGPIQCLAETYPCICLFIFKKEIEQTKKEASMLEVARRAAQQKQATHTGLYSASSRATRFHISNPSFRKGTLFRTCNSVSRNLRASCSTASSCWSCALRRALLAGCVASRFLAFLCAERSMRSATHLPERKNRGCRIVTAAGSACSNSRAFNP